MDADADSRKCVTVLTTAGGADEARAIANRLVERRLAACVQSFPATSRYFWDGEIREDAEILLLAKTRAELYPQVEAAIREMHSYVTPEIICLPILQGSSAYLDWIFDNTDAASVARRGLGEASP
jgi:periplasmic divalent cation tolerance protein